MLNSRAKSKRCVASHCICALGSFQNLLASFEFTRKVLYSSEIQEKLKAFGSFREDRRYIQIAYRVKRFTKFFVITATEAFRCIHEL